MEHIDIAANALEYAIKNGAEEASIKLSTGNGFSVVSQNQAIDLVEQFSDQSFSISVYIGKAIGSASTNDFSKDQLNMTIQKALSLSRLTEKDDCNLFSVSLNCQNVFCLILKMFWIRDWYLTTSREMYCLKIARRLLAIFLLILKL